MAAKASSVIGATTAEDAEKYIGGEGPSIGEQLVEYGMVYTHAFESVGRRAASAVASALSAINAPGPSSQIDGFENDDSYRRSRFLYKRGFATDQVNQDNIRENSLARQLQSKADQPATIRLIRRRNPEELARFDFTEGKVPWVNLIPPNTKFFLEGVQESREEKFQVVDTFGEWVAFFFGRKPEVYTYTGTLLNAKNHNWKNEFQQNYDEFLRGSQAVKNRATVFLQYDDVLVEGYILNATTQMSGDMNNSVPFSFSVLVISRSAINPEAMLQLRFERSGGSLLEADLFGTLQDTLDLTQTGQLGDLQTYVIMREYFSGNYLPSAGISRYRVKTVSMESGQAFPPGQIGGVRNEKSVNQSFRDDTDGKVSASEAGASYPGGV